MKMPYCEEPVNSGNKYNLRYEVEMVENKVHNALVRHVPRRIRPFEWDDHLEFSSRDRQASLP